MATETLPVYRSVRVEPFHPKVATATDVARLEGRIHSLESQIRRMEFRRQIESFESRLTFNFGIMLAIFVIACYWISQSR